MEVFSELLNFFDIISTPRIYFESYQLSFAKRITIHLSQHLTVYINTIFRIANQLYVKFNYFEKPREFAKIFK